MTGFAEYAQYDGLGLAELIRTRQVSAHEVLKAAIARIERHNPLLNAVVRPMFDEARGSVARVEERPFAGVPFLLKDLGAAYANVPMTAGSRSRRAYVPARHSELVERYLRAGLLIAGKTNVPEFGLAPVTESEFLGPARNPWDLQRTPGGSSGGSAAAVAARLVPAAHGNDGGGSIRIPASLCGLFGLKPTRGRTPQGSLVGETWFGLTVDHVISRSVRDSAALLDATHGADSGAPYAAPPPLRPFSDEVGADPGRLRIAFTSTPLLGTTMHADCVEAVQQAAQLCRELGHEVEETTPEINRDAWTEAFFLLAAAGASLDVDESARLAAHKPRASEYEPTTWLLHLVARSRSGNELAHAWDEMRRTGRRLATFFERYDVLLVPTLTQPPWPIGALNPTPIEERGMRALRRAPLRPALLMAFKQLSAKAREPLSNTPLFNMTGQPAMSCRCTGTRPGCRSGCSSSAASATKPRSSGSPASWRRRGRGAIACRRCSRSERRAHVTHEARVGATFQPEDWGGRLERHAGSFYTRCARVAP